MTISPLTKIQNLCGVTGVSIYIHRTYIACYMDTAIGWREVKGNTLEDILESASTLLEKDKIEAERLEKLKREKKR